MGGQQDPRIHRQPPQGLCFLVDLCGCWGWNSGPNASVANTSVAERSPQPLEHLHSLWKGKETRAPWAIGQRVGPRMEEMSAVHTRVVHRGESVSVHSGRTGLSSPESLYLKQENGVWCPRWPAAKEFNQSLHINRLFC